MGINTIFDKNYKEYVLIQNILNTCTLKNKKLILDVLINLDKEKLIINLILLNKINFIGYNAIKYHEKIKNLKKCKDIELFMKFFTIEDIFNFEFIKKETRSIILEIFNVEKKSLNLLIEKLYLNINIKPAISTVEYIKKQITKGSDTKYIHNYKNTIKIDEQKRIFINDLLKLFVNNKINKSLILFIKSNYELELDIYKGYLANKIRNK